MIKAGIIDPAKVVRTALQDAGSIAALLITAEAMIADVPQKDARHEQRRRRRRNGRLLSRQLDVACRLDVAGSVADRSTERGERVR